MFYQHMALVRGNLKVSVLLEGVHCTVLGGNDETVVQADQGQLASDKVIYSKV